MRFTTWAGENHGVFGKMIVSADNGTTEFSSDRCDKEHQGSPRWPVVIDHLISPRSGTRVDLLVLHWDRPESNSQFTISSTATTSPVCALRWRNDRKIEGRKMKNGGPIRAQASSIFLSTIFLTFLATPTSWCRPKFYDLAVLAVTMTYVGFYRGNHIHLHATAS